MPVEETTWNVTTTLDDSCAHERQRTVVTAALALLEDATEPETLLEL